MKIQTIFLLLIVFHCKILGQNIARAFIDDGLDTYIKKGLRDWNIPGLGLVIVKDQEIVKIKGYGFADIKENVKVDSETLFPIASITKHITSAALLSELRNKNISPDTSIVSFLSEYNFPEYVDISSISFRELLSHRLGYKSYQGDFLIFNSNFSSKEIVEKTWAFKPLYGKKRWGYHNSGYILAGDLLQKLSGIKYQDYITNNFFMKLGMLDTRTSFNDFLSTDNITQPYLEKGREILALDHLNLETVMASGGVYSNLNDMAKWLSMLLNSGIYQNETIINENLIEEMQKPFANVRRGRHPFHVVSGVKYGLGLRIQEYAGYKTIFHTGGLPGIITSMFLIPDKGVGVLIFCNKDKAVFIDALKLEIIDAYLNKPYRNYNKRYFDYFEKKKKTEKRKIYFPLSSEQQDLLRGTYQNDIYGEIVIKSENNNLKMHLENHPDTYGTIKVDETGEIKCIFNSSIFEEGILKVKKDKNMTKLILVLPDFDPNRYDFYKINP